MASRVDKLFKLIYKQLENDLDDFIKKEVMQDEIRSFRRTTESWEKKPTFSLIKTNKGYGIYTDSLLYYWIDKGTKPHYIKAKKGLLAIPTSRFYRTDYYPKSYSPQRGESPNLTSKNRYTDNNKITKPQEVLHSGIEARNWSDIIASKFEQRALKKLNKYRFRKL